MVGFFHLQAHFYRMLLNVMRLLLFQLSLECFRFQFLLLSLNAIFLFNGF